MTARGSHCLSTQLLNCMCLCHETQVWQMSSVSVLMTLIVLSYKSTAAQKLAVGSMPAQLVAL